MPATAPNALTFYTASGVVYLDTRCVTCDGDGVVMNPAWQSYFAQQKEQRFLDLTTDERDLWMDEHEPREREEIACGECRGSGFVPTAAGRAVLAFVQRHAGGRS